MNNPVKAGINCVATGYEWSSARCYFNQIDLTADMVPIVIINYLIIGRLILLGMLIRQPMWIIRLLKDYIIAVDRLNTS